MKLLIIGNLYDNHNGRFVVNLRKENPNISVSFLYDSDSRMTLPSYCDCINNLLLIVRLFPSFLYRIPLIRALCKIIDQYKSVRALVKSRKSYDVINVQYVSVYSVLASRHFHRLARTVLLSPWGSDVYRVSRLFLPLVRNVYKRADYVSLFEGRFRDDCARIFRINKKKIVNIGIGSDAIDYIKEHNKNISKEKAKARLGFENSYIVVCGYNASPAQNHQVMIEAISKNISCFPEDCLIVLPMTYSGTSEYKETIRGLLEERGLRYILFDNYLSIEDLFYLRRSADMFIHIQNTDANSSAVLEFLLTDTKILNGSWLRYKELEKFVIPYYLVTSLDSIANDICDALKDTFTPIPSELRLQIEGYGWANQIKLWSDFFEQHS